MYLPTIPTTARGMAVLRKLVIGIGFEGLSAVFATL